MSIFVYFLIAAVISFVGSIQPGPVNMAVLLAASKRDYKGALWLAIGGSIPEFFFCLVAIQLYASVASWKMELDMAAKLIDFIFIAAGLWFFFKKNNTLNNSKLSKYKGFLSGILLAMFNPQLIIFWLAIIIWLSSQQFYFGNNINSYCFSFGATLGAFAIHYLLLHVVHKNETNQFIQFFSKQATKIIGVILISIATFHLWFQ